MTPTPELLSAIELVRKEREDRKNAFVEELKQLMITHKVSFREGIQVIVHDADADLSDVQVTEGQQPPV